MWNLLVYKGLIAILIVGLAGASGVATYFYNQQNTKIFQAADLNNQVNQLEGQISALNSQITALNKQIDSLNSQISQLQASNTQLGGTNSQLLSQIQQLQTQISQLQCETSQLQTQIGQLQARVADLTQKLNLQQSRVISSEVCVYSDCPGGGNGGNPIGNQVFVNLGTIYYSGYLRVSWTGPAHASFSAQVFDVNITTPVATSATFSIPVSANATGNVWFTNYDCVPIPAGTFCPPLTYSLTYWY